MKKLLFILLLITPTFLYSQSTWRNGTVITREGVTLEGKINDKEWNSDPKEIEFQKEGQPIQLFTVNDILEFATDRPARYRACSIQFDGDEQTTNNLPETKEPASLTKDKAFLKVIVNAKIALLLFSEKNGRLHFFIQRDSSITELLNRTYKSAQTFTAVNEKYKQQLFLITNDCQQIQTKIKNQKYNESTLQKLLTEINKCKGFEVTPVWSGPAQARKPASFGIAVQAYFDHTKFPYVISSMSKLNFGGGIFYEIYNQKRPNRLSVYNELLYKTVNQPAEYNYTYPVKNVNIQFSRIKLLNVLRFSYPLASGSRFFWGVGLETGMRMNTKIDGKSTLGGYNIESELEFGFVANAGKTFLISKSLKITTELRFEVQRRPYSSTNFLGSEDLGISIQVPLK